MTIEFEVVYDRLTKDYQCLVDGRCVGYRATYSAGDSLCRQTIADLIADGMAYTAAELDAPIECSQPNNLCSVHNPCPEHAAAAAQYLAEPVQSGLCWCITWHEHGHQGECPDCRWRARQDAMAGEEGDSTPPDRTRAVLA